MDKINDGGPAFPSHGSMGEVVAHGMTLRDYFAGQALAGILSCTRDFADYPRSKEGRINAAVDYADALIAALRAKP